MLACLRRRPDLLEIGVVSKTSYRVLHVFPSRQTPPLVFFAHDPNLHAANLHTISNLLARF